MLSFSYVDPPNSNLVCCICRTAFVDPTTTRTCAHTFCRDCIIRALAHASQCPVDRSPLSTGDLAPANPIVRSMVDELLVECVHREEGCEYTCQRQLLVAHLKDSCKYNKEAEPLSNSKDTGDTTASSCSHADHGCPWTGPNPAAHLSTCPYESLKEFFPRNSAYIAALSEENLLLRSKLDTLTATLGGMRKDLERAKVALGPWCRGEGRYIPAPRYEAAAMAPSAELPASIQPLSASGSGQESAADTGLLSAESIAAYFPAEEDVYPARQPHAPNPYGYGPAPNGPSPMRVTAPVAPLDLGTTLEGTLLGLRASMVSLAGAVDSVARRSEIALTNEVVRIGEEVCSLRANGHGLRMQVHALMMDRNAQITGRDPLWSVPVPQQGGATNPPGPLSITKL
ncbi:hypothetical protein BD779DRAFT_969226 [Infundibulicybe gibba]|nr:hypothetical protein BD779DRAFT_969226 [Infundibulicybe gibba]